MQVPDYCEPLVGIRAWTIERRDGQNVLAQLTRWAGRPYIWVPEDRSAASCIHSACLLGAGAGTYVNPFYDEHPMIARQHKPPDMHSTCGFWAFKPDAWIEEGVGQVLTQVSHMHVHQGLLPDVIVGEVYLWGRVVEHTSGYRAQYAYPKTLNDPGLAERYHVDFQPCTYWEATYEHWKAVTRSHRRAAEDASTLFYPGTGTIFSSIPRPAPGTGGSLTIQMLLDKLTGKK